MLKALIEVLRPRQWIKNGFVLAPLLFSGLFLDPALASQAVIAVILFCIASSASYIVNDIGDIESDRRHPIKSRTRPLAAGSLKVSHAVTLLIALYAVLAVAYFRFPGVIAIILVYLALNVAYTVTLKDRPVIDIFTIALGYVLRVYAGAIAISVPVSSWMFITTLCLALYLAAIKRRQELVLNGNATRKVAAQYSVALVERYAEMSATGAIIFYSLFVISTHPDMVITIPLVLFGLFRYWYVVESLDGGESPTNVLLNDWPLALTVIIWAAACAWIIWSLQS